MSKRRTRELSKPPPVPPAANGHATLAPEAEPNDPQNRHVWIVPLPRTMPRVNEETALTLSTVWACLKVVSEDIAGLPWRVMERRAGGKGSDEVPEDPSDWLLHTQANPETPAFQFRETLIAHALSWGNGYAEIERDNAGRPAWLWQLTPDRVHVRRAENGRIVYDVTNPGSTLGQFGDTTLGEPPVTLEKEEVFHLRGLGFDGLIGYPVIRLAARVISAGLSAIEAIS